VEGLSEYLEKPLYAVSLFHLFLPLSSFAQVPSGELSANAKEAETQLSRIFRQAEKWKAILLLDEADVFLRRRSLDHARDAHVTMFLRTLEYYRGILFLMTNRVEDFDDTMQSRIGLPLKYPDLSKDTRMTIWGDFLGRNTSSTVNKTDIENLAERKLNGRQVYDCTFQWPVIQANTPSQIKNAVKLAHEWASEGNFPLTYSNLETVLDMYRDFERDMVGHVPESHKQTSQ
jgi:SpoVK/Ycf46/Vps4 family AAA+-type ATPase